jgi:hypothetical protein
MSCTFIEINSINNNELLRVDLIAKVERVGNFAINIHYITHNNNMARYLWNSREERDKAYDDIRDQLIPKKSI